jgi:hypothetical protein
MQLHGIDYWISRNTVNSTNRPKDTSVTTLDTILVSLDNTIFTFYSGWDIKTSYPWFGVPKKVVGDTLFIQYQTSTGFESGSSKYYNYTLDEARIEFNKDKPIINNLRLLIIKGQDWDIHNNMERGSTDLDHQFIMLFENVPYNVVNGAYKVSISSENILKYLTFFNTYRNYINSKTTIDYVHTSQIEYLKLLTDIPIEIGNDAYINFELYP